MYIHNYTHRHTLFLPPITLRLACIHMVLHPFHLIIWFGNTEEAFRATVPSEVLWRSLPPTAVVPDLSKYQDHLRPFFPNVLLWKLSSIQKIKRIAQWTVLKQQQYDLVIIFYHFITNFLISYFEVVLCYSVWM